MRSIASLEVVDVQRKKNELPRKEFFSPAVLRVEVNERVGKKHILPHLFWQKEVFIESCIKSIPLFRGLSYLSAF